jgi:GntR family transcriptional regulator
MANGVTRDDPLPLYKQVKERLLRALDDGTIPPRAKLASERELVELYGVSRITIRQAMTELVLEGHLRSHPGKGFYPTGRPKGVYELELLRSFTATAVAHGRRPGSRLLTAAQVEAPEEVARALQLGAGEQVISLRRLRLIDDQPVAIAHDWMPAAIVPGILELDWTVPNSSLYAELAGRYGLLPQRGHTILSARLADAEESRLLELPPPAAVLGVEQMAFDVDERPLNLTLSTHHPTRYPLRLDQDSRTSRSGR